MGERVVEPMIKRQNTLVSFTAIDARLHPVKVTFDTSAIVSVTEIPPVNVSGGKCCITLAGSTEPYTVKETYDEVVAAITEPPPPPSMPHPGVVWTQGSGPGRLTRPPRFQVGDMVIGYPRVPMRVIKRSTRRTLYSDWRQWVYTCQWSNRIEDFAESVLTPCVGFGSSRFPVGAVVRAKGVDGEVTIVGKRLIHSRGWVYACNWFDADGMLSTGEFEELELGLVPDVVGGAEGSAEGGEVGAQGEAREDGPFGSQAASVPGDESAGGDS